MSSELKGFLDDLVEIIKEKYNDTLVGSDSETESTKQFRLGVNLGYYDILDIINSQLEVFGYDNSKTQTIILGKKIVKIN